MSNIETQFEEFLSNIEPSKEAVQYAQDAHKPIRDHLSEDEKFAKYFVDSFLYGSYRRHTAVGDIKDVDIVVLTNFDEQDKSPASVLKELKEALARYYKDPENPEYQRRSIRINDPLPDNPDTEMTLDVIPAVVVTDNDSPLKVPDREVGKWIWSHPKGHIAHTTELNKDEISEGRFVPLAKIIKWWWSYQCEINQPDVEHPKPKGFWLECLVGENFDSAQHNWADHFIAVLQNVSSRYADEDDVPELDDPGLKNQKINSSMTAEEFKQFMKILNDSLEIAIDARNASSDAESSKKWQKIFGPKFPLSEDTSESNSVKKDGPIIIKSNPAPHG